MNDEVQILIKCPDGSYVYNPNAHYEQILDIHIRIIKWSQIDKIEEG